MTTPGLIGAQSLDLHSLTQQPLSRRGLLTGAAVLGAAVLIPAGAAQAAGARVGATGTAGSRGRHRTLFGAFPGTWNYPNVDPTETKAQMRARVCQAYGVQDLPVERIFNEQSWAVPAAGNPAIVSFAQNPSSVANGDFDSQIRAFVTALDPATTYWLCLNHECDQQGRAYTAVEQVAGFRHFSNVVRSIGKSNVKLAPILMSWTISQGVDKWRQWYPGADYVDALGWDAYWRPTLKHTAADVYGPAMAINRAEGLPLLVGETSMGAMGHGGQELVDGVYKDIPESDWTQFTTDALAYLDVPSTAAVCWFETNKGDGCWRLQGHSGALAVYAAAVQACTQARIGSVL